MFVTSQTLDMDESLIEKNAVLKRSFDFALMIIEYCDALQEQKKFVISNQLLKSGTSIGANIMEAQNPESKADFIHKMKIAAKEAEETQYWLQLCNYSKKYPDCSEMISRLEEIQRLLSTILSTAKRKSPVSYLLALLVF
jgi:four helix bundle protein